MKLRTTGEGIIKAQALIAIVCTFLLPARTMAQPFGTMADWVADRQDTQAGALAFGDMDNDGDLDLFVGNYDNGSFPAAPENNFIFYNIDGTLETTASWVSDLADDVAGVALGDVDGDGDLDLITATTNFGEPEGLYINDGLSLTGPSGLTDNLNSTKGSGSS